jgi:hypothetical protein
MNHKQAWKCVQEIVLVNCRSRLCQVAVLLVLFAMAALPDASAQGDYSAPDQNPIGIQPAYPGEPSNKPPVETTLGPAKLRVYGTVLLNASFTDSDEVGQDVPLWPFPSSVNVTFPDGSTQRAGLIHDTTFSARQSVFGVVLNQADPPTNGWNTSALAEFDFFGTTPVDTLLPQDRVLNQPRLRKAYFQLQKGHFKLILGQDDILISPMDPISLSHVAYPLGYSAGDLFGWLPQARVEYDHGFGNTTMLLQFGLLRPAFGDARLGDQPPVNITVNTSSGLGERASQPFYQARVAFSRPMHGSKATLGLAGHYGQERIGAHRTLDSWAFALDLSMPIVPNRLILRGEAYVGSNLVPFGGGILQGVAAVPTTAPFTTFHKVGDVGGWPELTFIATKKDVFYAGISADEPVRHDRLPGSTRVKNAVMWASYFRKLTAGTTASLEYSNWDFQTTTFAGNTPAARGATGRGNVINVALAYQF